MGMSDIIIIVIWRKNMKKLKTMLSIALVIMLIASVIPFSASADSDEGNWVSAWSTSPISASISDLGVLDYLGVTLTAVSSRVTITPTVSGSQVRLTFSNEFGVTPLIISACTIGKTGSNSKTVECKTIRDVRFDGKIYKIIPAGKVVTSDPLDFAVTSGEKLTVTTYFRGINTQRTIGLIGGDTYAAVGNYTNLSSMLAGIPLSLSADSGDYQVIPALKGIDVFTDNANACNCVIFGDSTVANEIPRLLEAKLHENGISNVSVTQQAIKGNRLVANGVGAAAKLLGEAGINRFERDVLQQAGVKYVVVKLGINDIVHPYCESKAAKLTPVTFDEMVAGYNQLIEMAHNNGIKIYFAELTPWKGYTRNILGTGDDVQWAEEIDALRVALNAWFASADCNADGYIAFPNLADPADVNALAPGFSPDGIHFTTAGQQAFVDAFPIDIFR